MPMYTEGGVTAWLIMRTRCYHWFSLPRCSARVPTGTNHRMCAHYTTNPLSNCVLGLRFSRSQSLRAGIKFRSNSRENLITSIEIGHSRTKVLQPCFNFLTFYSDYTLAYATHDILYYIIRVAQFIIGETLVKYWHTYAWGCILGWWIVLLVWVAYPQIPHHKIL